jgi:putative membrane protein
VPYTSVCSSSLCGLLLALPPSARTSAPPEAPASLNAVDFIFSVKPTWVPPSRWIQEGWRKQNGSNAAIRSYAHLVVTSHIPIVDALNAIMRRKNIIPLNTLLQGAYNAMPVTAKPEHGAAFDRDYVNGRVEYQTALFQQEIQNGIDPDLREVARQTLPKIEDHLKRAAKLMGASVGRSASN